MPDFPPSSENSHAYINKEREKLHQQLLSVVAHDLKTPLVSMIGSLEIYETMKDKLSPEKQQALIRVALQEAHRLDDFITNMLEMTKFDTGLVKTKFETVDIYALLNTCLVRMSKQLHGSNVHIHEEPFAVEVSTDPILLSQAICVVLDNAVKHGGVQGAIFIDYGKTSEHQGFIHVRDNGKGVANANKSAIFDKFTRFSREGQKTVGAGLGLPIAQKIMRLLGGDISVDNHPEGGAIFSLRFTTAK